MHVQVVWVSMGSPLVPVLANIFVGFYGSLLFENYCKPHAYLRYVDDTFFFYFRFHQRCWNFSYPTRFLSLISAIYHESENRLYFTFFWTYWLNVKLVLFITKVLIGSLRSEVYTPTGIPLSLSKLNVISSLFHLMFLILFLL